MQSPMKQVDREEFISYCRENDLFDKSEAVTGEELSAMQYVDNGQLMAYSQYSNFGKRWGMSSTVISYFVREN